MRVCVLGIWVLFSAASCLGHTRLGGKPGKGGRMGSPLKSEDSGNTSPAEKSIRTYAWAPEHAPLGQVGVKSPGTEPEKTGFFVRIKHAHPLGYTIRSKAGQGNCQQRPQGFRFFDAMEYLGERGACDSEKKRAGETVKGFVFLVASGIFAEFCPGFRNKKRFFLGGGNGKTPEASESRRLWMERFFLRRSRQSSFWDVKGFYWRVVRHTHLEKGTS